MVLRLMATCLLAGILAACGPVPLENKAERDQAPPDMPEGAVSETFERQNLPDADTEVTDSDTSRAESDVRYWGVEEGAPLPIIWDDLMPEGSGEALEKEYAEFYAALEARYASRSPEEGLEAIEEGSELDYMPQLGGFETVDDLDGVLIRIPGYVVPFDFNLEKGQEAFLLAPYMGACIHTPPPPPNQIIHVEADPAVKIDDIWVAYWLEGTLRAQTQESDLAAAAYTLELNRIEPYAAP